MYIAIINKSDSLQYICDNITAEIVIFTKPASKVGLDDQETSFDGTLTLQTQWKVDWWKSNQNVIFITVLPSNRWVPTFFRDATNYLQVLYGRPNIILICSGAPRGARGPCPLTKCLASAVTAVTPSSWQSSHIQSSWHLNKRASHRYKEQD